MKDDYLTYLSRAAGTVCITGAARVRGAVRRAAGGIVILRAVTAGFDLRVPVVLGGTLLTLPSALGVDRVSRTHIVFGLPLRYLGTSDRGRLLLCCYNEDIIMVCLHTHIIKPGDMAILWTAQVFVSGVGRV